MRPLPGARELLERGRELAALEQLIGGGGSQVLVIEGPPGIGKTALLTEARRLGREAGLRVLGARGSELEQSFSYGVVQQLFEPLLASMTPASERVYWGELRRSRSRCSIPPTSPMRRWPIRRLRRCTASTG